MTTNKNIPGPAWPMIPLDLELGEGKHVTRQDGVCLMEAVAWIAGEKHSDRPECACPVLGRFAMGINDLIPGELRTPLLLPLAPLLAGTRASLSVEVERAKRLADWACDSANSNAPHCYYVDIVVAAESLCRDVAYWPTTAGARAVAGYAAQSVSALAATPIWQSAADIIRELCMEHHAAKELATCP